MPSRSMETERRGEPETVVRTGEVRRGIVLLDWLSVEVEETSEESVLARPILEVVARRDVVEADAKELREARSALGRARGAEA